MSERSLFQCWEEKCILDDYDTGNCFFFGKLAVICVWLSNKVEITRYVRKQRSTLWGGLSAWVWLFIKVWTFHFFLRNENLFDGVNLFVIYCDRYQSRWGFSSASLTSSSYFCLHNFVGPSSNNIYINVFSPPNTSQTCMHICACFLVWFNV